MNDIKQEYQFLDELNDLCERVLMSQDLVLVCVTGKSGAGKSTFGKYVRKNGFGVFRKSQISVIDDSVMSLDLFYVLNKRVRIKSKEMDHLEPFMSLLPKRKKIIFYVNATPQRRITKTNILLNLYLNDEDERIARLKQRDSKISAAHFIDSQAAKEQLNYDFYLNKEVV